MTVHSHPFEKQPPGASNFVKKPYTMGAIGLAIRGALK
jgi:hypothetical protein